MQDKLTIEILPKRILREVKDMLRGAENEAWVICRDGMLAVVRKNYYCDESRDEKLLLIIREEDLFTEDERTENYINYNQEYPSWYKGKRDRTVFRRMRRDMRLDKQAGIFYEPIGRLVNGDFVYNGEIRVHNAFALEEE